MQLSRGQKWFSISLLAVVLPMSLLATFRLTGVLPEPSVEAITVEPVSWQMDRPRLDPDDTLHIDETIENGYSDNYTSIEIGIHLYYYKEDWNEIPFGKHRDGMSFKLNITTAVAEGFNSSFVVRFHAVDAYSTIYIERQFGNVSGQYLATYNATIIELRAVSKEWMDGGWYNVGEAYVKAESTSSHCGLTGQIHWVFDDQNVEDHHLEATLEFTHFNQTTSQKILVPIILEMPIPT